MPASQWTVPAYPYVPLAPGGAVLAGAGDRDLARLIDIAVLFLPALVAELLAAVPVVLVVVTGDDRPDPAALVGAAVGAMLLFLALLLGVYYVYEVAMRHRTGQTVGKRVMKIRVVRAEDGGPIDRRVATRRWLVQHVASLVAPYFNYADALWLLWDQPYRQCLHDKAASTVVVKVPA